MVYETEENQVQMRDHRRTIRGGNNLGWLNEDRSHTHETMTVRKQGWTLSQCALTLWVMLGQTTHDMTSNSMTSCQYDNTRT